MHNGCALEVIMKMYRPHSYYQTTEQLHSKTMGPVLTLGGRWGSDRGWVLGDSGSSLWAGDTLRSSLIPFCRFPDLLTPNLSQDHSFALVQFQGSVGHFCISRVTENSCRVRPRFPTCYTLHALELSVMCSEDPCPGSIILIS